MPRLTTRVAQCRDVRDIADATRAREHRVFSGRLDTSRLGFGERAITLALRAPVGDFRDWAAINRWAKEIAADVLRTGTAHRP